ncbi:MAG: hypothetical protein EXX96DRAFT_547155 [Benjaminiella poitrasii]|nr:MAG: hypothetical protein EXX96DRAFT_547155 [Benjaminiella poitrasii]
MSETEAVNAVVILSDDEEEVVINENGKRWHSGERAIKEEGRKDANDGDDGGIDSEDPDEEYMSDEDYFEDEPVIYQAQMLPDDHEPVILDERTKDNPLKELDDIFTAFKSDCIRPDPYMESFDSSFACGGPLRRDAPNIALNIDGVQGPIAFPLDEKDAQRILSVAPNEKDAKDKTTSLELEASKILLNLTFQKYLDDTVLPDVLSTFGVPSRVAKNSRLQAYRFYVRTNGGMLTLPESVPSGAYGTVFLVLPSEFNGGSISATWADDEIKFRPESSAFECAYYIAWFNDVEIKFHPITYGYQLVIAFSLIYDPVEGDSIILESLKYGQLTTGDIVLSNADQEKANSFVERAATYFEGHKDAEYPIFYMLEHRYMSDCLEMEHLRKGDKFLAQAFLAAAEKAGYHMYLGFIERNVKASVDDESEIPSDIIGKGKNECSMDEEGIYLTTTTIYDRYTLLCLMDIDGNNVLGEPIEFDQKKRPVIIQGPSWYSRCKPETQDYQKDESSVTYMYPVVSALVFFPKEKLNDIIQMSLSSSELEKEM